MIWYNVLTLEPIAPGKCEDGGEPSIGGYWCQNCKTERVLKYRNKIGRCEVCQTEVLVQA